MAGLSCAVHLARAGRRVALYEATPQPGGRCRSFHDRQIDRLIDNGNHLLLSGNREALRFLDAVGAADSLTGPDTAAFDFYDLRADRSYRLRPNAGPVPWWVFVAGRRVPGTRFRDYLSILRLLAAPVGATVADRIDRKHPLFERFWEPLTVAAMNTPAEHAAASMMRAVLLRTFLSGGEACRPLLPRRSLSASLIDPAIRWLRQAGAEIHLNRRLRAIEPTGGTVERLRFADRDVDVATDIVVLAVPPDDCRRLLPDQITPEEGSMILNAHFAIDPTALPAPLPRFVGLLNGRAQWAFAREGVISATVSAAVAAEERTQAVAADLWRDVSRPFGLAAAPLPPYRLLTEKRATFLQTPENLRRRPKPATAFRNLILAGDWTDTGLPATIEGAILSGRRAAQLALARAPL